MKRLIIKFPDDSYINIAAEHMDKPEDSNMVYDCIMEKTLFL